MFFQHVQGSTSFSIVQFSRSCADRLSRAARLLYLIQFRLSRTFLKIFSSRSASRPAAVAFVTACLFYFIQDLLSRPFLKFFLSVPAVRFCWPPAASSLLLSGASLRSSGIWLCNRCCRSRQLDYNTTGTARCQHLFSIFFKFFCLDFSSPISSRVCRGKAQNLGPRCPAPAGKAKAAALPGRESAAV